MSDDQDRQGEMPDPHAYPPPVPASAPVDPSWAPPSGPLPAAPSYPWADYARPRPPHDARSSHSSGHHTKGRRFGVGPALLVLLLGLGGGFGGSALYDGLADEIALRRKGGYSALRAMEKRLAESPFFTGRYTLADIALYAYTHVAHEGGFDLGEYPAVRAWLGRVAEEPGHVPMRDPAEPV